MLCKEFVFLYNLTMATYLSWVKTNVKSQGRDTELKSYLLKSI